MHTPKFWQSRFPAALLLPLSAVFGALALGRRALYRSGLLRSERLAVPVVVVGNISAGGAGKTPTVLYLAQALRAAGLRPGIVSRGYGGQQQGVAQVDPQGSAQHFGDEPLLLARSSGCPVFVGRDRPAAARALLAAHPTTDVLLCDDGLQHYRLARDIEIAVVDGQRGLQNGWLLPAGPLRETRQRLASVDAILFNGGQPELGACTAPATPRFLMQLLAHSAYRLAQPEQSRPLTEFAGQPLAALAGIGHPARFFATLRAAGLHSFSEHAFPDHHAYSAADLAAIAAPTLLCTEKDAVKLAALQHDGNIWVVPVAAQIAPDLAAWLIQRLRALQPPTRH